MTYVVLQNDVLACVVAKVTLNK